MTWNDCTDLLITHGILIFLIIWLMLVIASRYLFSKYLSHLMAQYSDPLIVTEDPLFISWLKDPELGIFKMVMGPLLDEGYISSKDCAGVYQSTKKKKKTMTPLEIQLLEFIAEDPFIRNANNLFSELKNELEERAEKLKLIVSKETKKKIFRRNRITMLPLMAIGICFLTVSWDEHSAITQIVTMFMIFPIIPVLFNEAYYIDIMISPTGTAFLIRYENTLSVNKNDTPQVNWLKKILAGNATITGLTYYNSGSSVYINSSSYGCDSSCDSTCSVD